MHAGRKCKLHMHRPWDRKGTSVLGVRNEQPVRMGDDQWLQKEERICLFVYTVTPLSVLIAVKRHTPCDV